MAAAAVGGILLASVTLYAVLGGADFGGGLWDLLAGGDRRGRAPRALIEESITPVWEANHVWLIFDLVIFWTAFPHAFAAVMTTAALPLWLAVAGIVLRGAGFAFREELSRLPQQRAAGAAFAFSSLLTPLFVGTCSYIAAVYLVGEAAHRGDRSLQHYFTRRAQAAAIITGALSLATLAELHISNAALFSRLTGRALALVIIAGLCGLAVLGLLTASRPRGIRVPAALGVAAVIWGWGVAQYPELLPGTSMTLTGAGTPHATLVAIIWLSAAGALIVGPSYALLFALQGRQVLQAGDEETDFPARQGSRGGRDPSN